MQSNQRKGIFFQLLLAIGLHVLIVIAGVISFEKEIKVVGGLAGDVFKKIGSAQSAAIPIKISTETGGLADAREIIAQRKQFERQAQEAQQRQEQEAKEAEEAEKRRQEEQKAAEAERTRQAALEKAKQLAEEKAQKEREERRKIEAQRKALEKAEAERKAKEAAARQTQKDLAASSASKAATNAQSQAARKKSSSSQQKSAADSNASFNDLFGNGGGDGAKISNYSADDIQRYKQRVGAIIKSHFIVNSSFANTSCRILIIIEKDGMLKVEGIQDGKHGSAICAAGINAIAKTKQVPAPPKEIYNDLRYQTIYFQNGEVF